MAAVLQNTAAHSRAHSLALAASGVAAASNHPSSGERPDMDDLLSVPEQVVVPEGAKPSKFIGGKFERVGDFLRDMLFLGSADADGLTCEVPFTGGLPAVGITDASQLQT